MLVRATNISSKYKIKIKELGRIAKDGEEFEVTPIRYQILSGANMYKAVFVKKVTESSENLIQEKPERKKRTRKKKEEVNE